MASAPTLAGGAVAAGSVIGGASDEPERRAVSERWVPAEGVVVAERRIIGGSGDETGCCAICDKGDVADWSPLSDEAATGRSSNAAGTTDDIDLCAGAAGAPNGTDCSPIADRGDAVRSTLA